LIALGLVLGACLAAGAGCKRGGAKGSDAAISDAAADAKVAGLPAPEDVAAPPPDAPTTPSGLASKVLAAGTGTDHPGPNDSVKVNYTGWTTDGKMFDSTIAPPQPGRQPQPATLSLARVIPGWTEGVQLMVVGEKRRFWVPQDLAYKGRPGPQGTLVFDIELLDFTPGPRAPTNVASPPADAPKTADGIASEVMQKGTGTAHPQPNDGVRVNYSLWQTDGKLLDQSKEGTPAMRPVTGQFDGWAAALEQMVVGEKRTFWIPAAMANLKPQHGQAQTPRDLTFVVELLEILAAPKTPADLKAPPKDAIVEKDGLASKILVRGTGKVHPAPTDRVTVKYAGWTSDGKMFDSSYTRGEPANFTVSGLIPGWTEALQLMVEGEKRRLWIPEQLAYKGRPGPQGMLIFEVELEKIGEPPHPHAGPGMMGGPPPATLPPPGH
jgi:peptidylprolyl isomerase